MKRIGTIAATTTSANNTTTATPFRQTYPATLAGLPLVIQPSAACYVRSGKLASLSADSTDGTLLEQNGLYDWPMDTEDHVLACVAVSGSVNLKVFVAPTRR